MSTCSAAAAAASACSTLHNPFFWGMTPRIFPALVLIKQPLGSNATEYPALTMRLMETTVMLISGAYKASLRVTGVDDAPLGMLIFRSPVPMA